MAKPRELGPLGWLVFRFIINTGALAIAVYIVNYFAPDSIVLADWQSALATAAILGLVNALIRPLVSCFTCLLQVITLGLFTLVVNALMLLLTSYLAEYLRIGFHVNGFGPAFFGAILLSIVSTILTHLMR